MINLSAAYHRLCNILGLQIKFKANVNEGRTHRNKLLQREIQIKITWRYDNFYAFTKKVYNYLNLIQTMFGFFLIDSVCFR